MSDKRATRRALIFIFITVLMDTIGFGIVIPVMPKLIIQLTGEGPSRAVLYGGWLLFIYALMQLFFAPIIGNLSDRFGRRLTLLLSLATFGFDYTLMGLAPSFAWLFVGRTLSGIAGATGSTVNAYVADISPAEERAQNFGMIGAAWGLGFIVGPVLGGLLGHYGPRVPFFAAAGLALLNVLYGLIVLPESLPPERRRPFSLKRANPVGALIQVRQYPLVLGMFAVLLFYLLAHDAYPSTWSFYGMVKFGWGEREIGYSLGFIGLTGVIVQAGLIRAIMPRIGERRAVYLGLVMMALSFMGFAFSTQGWMMYAIMTPGALGALTMPALQSLMSNQVPANAQGELQGAITSLMSLTAIIAPLLMTQLFGYFTSEAAPLYFPGAAFVAAGLMAGMSLIMFRRAVTATAVPAPASSATP